MISVDLPISFLLGGGLALVTQLEGNPGRYNRDRTLLRGMLLQSLVVSPIILYFLLRFPDWEWHYLFDARRFFFESTSPSLGLLLIVLLLAALNFSFYFGFTLVEARLKQGRLFAAAGLLGGVGLFVLTIVILLLDRTLHLGTYAQYQAGNATLIFMHIEFLFVMAVAGLLIAFGLVKVLTGGQSDSV